MINLDIIRINQSYNDIVKQDCPESEPRKTDASTEPFPMRQMLVSIFNWRQVSKSNKNAINHSHKNNHPYETLHKRSHKNATAEPDY